jgi:hypothetical protein
MCRRRKPKILKPGLVDANPKVLQYSQVPKKLGKRSAKYRRGKPII